MLTDSKPLPMVTILTPTCRPDFLLQCEKYVMAQTYPKDRLEWVIVDSGDEFKMPYHVAVKTHILQQKGGVGMLRNMGLRVASGDLVVHFDDDDWHAPDRIERQVVPFLVRPHLELVATDNYYVGLFDETPVRAMRSWSWEFETFSSGGSFMYRRRAWQKHPFANIRHGEDLVFAKHVRMWHANAAHNLRDPTFFVCVRHRHNTCTFDDDVRERATVDLGDWLSAMMGRKDFDAIHQLSVNQGPDELHQGEKERSESGGE